VPSLTLVVVAATHLESLEKSGNKEMIRVKSRKMEEKSGKICSCMCYVTMRSVMGTKQALLDMHVIDCQRSREELFEHSCSGILYNLSGFCLSVTR